MNGGLKNSKEKMSQNNSKEINHQLYVDLVKQNKLNWNIFINFMQDLSFSDMNRLRNLNAILLTELTMNYSDMDRMKYLNEILLIQFKNHIQKDQKFEIERDQNCEKSIESHSNVHEETDDEEIKDELAFMEKEEVTEILSSDNNSKSFLCHNCNKKYNIYFHLKQHMRNVHEEKKTNNFPININDDQKLDEHEFTNKNDMMHQLQRHSNSNEKKQA